MQTLPTMKELPKMDKADLDELFARNPMELTTEEIKYMVEFLRNRYKSFAIVQEAKRKRPPRKLSVNDIDINDIDINSI